MTIQPAPGGRPGGTVTSSEPAATMCQTCGRQPSVIVLEIGPYCLGCLGVLAMQRYSAQSRRDATWEARALKAEGELSRLQKSAGGELDRQAIRRELGRMGTSLGELRKLAKL